jgi:hypothetical protein
MCERSGRGPGCETWSLIGHCRKSLFPGIDPEKNPCHSFLRNKGVFLNKDVFLTARETLPRFFLIFASFAFIAVFLCYRGSASPFPPVWSIPKRCSRKALQNSERPQSVLNMRRKGRSFPYLRKAAMRMSRLSSLRGSIEPAVRWRPILSPPAA